MKVGNMKYLLFILLLVTVLITAGCTSGNQNVVAATTATTATPTPTITTIPTAIPTTIPTTMSTAIITTIPTPDPTDISQIKFLHYGYNDLDLKYPEGWTINESSHEGIFCGERSQQNMCFTRYRTITFANPDNTLKFIVTISTFRDLGNYVLSNTQTWCENSIYRTYPGVSARDVIGYYRYFFDNKHQAVITYDVVMPKSSDYYPLAYTDKMIITQRYDYQFRFITDNENFDKYHNLKEWMISSATSTDTVASVYS